MSALLLWLALAGVSVPPSSASSASSDCAAVFAEGLRAVERAPQKARVGLALRALSACPRLGALATAAGRAANQPRAAREAALVEASGIDAACVRARCVAMPLPLEMAPRALSDVDGGSYAFAIVVYRALASSGLLTPTSERILLNLLLGSALEGEGRR